jgi:hypothetical protein
MGSKRISGSAAGLVTKGPRSMANYKRKHPRNGGCLRCKPHKMNGQKPGIAKTLADRRADLRAKDEG